MSPEFILHPPFLVFGREGGDFFVFSQPSALAQGSDLERLEQQAQAQGGWVAGGWRYGRAEGSPEGWWGLFAERQIVSATQLRRWADRSEVFVGPLVADRKEASYTQAFETLHQALAAGQIYQANLTFFFHSRAVAAGSWTWASALRLWLDLEPGPQACFAVGPAGEIVASLSPELFFERQGTLVRCRPMKGTAPRSADPQTDAESGAELAASSKNRAENLMITDMIRNDLGQLAIPGSVEVPHLYTLEAYPTVWQLTSTVEARLAESQAWSPLLSALFPCASITGAPKLRAQDWLRTVELHERGWYTGTLGWFRPASVGSPDTEGHFSVLIRTLVWPQVADPGFQLGVGGGIVWDSHATSEYSEAIWKTRFLQSRQRTFSLTEAILWEPIGGFFLLEDHWQRLALACRDFGGELDPLRWQTRLDQAVVLGGQSWPGQSLKLRVLIDPEFRLTVEAEPLSTLPPLLRCALAEQPFGPESLLFRRYKTTQRQIYSSAIRPGIDQILHWNERGELTESTSMNLVLEMNGRFLTPALSCGLLNGTWRSRLLRDGQIHEAILPVGALKEASQLWLINSVRRWQRAEFIKEVDR